MIWRPTYLVGDAKDQGTWGAFKSLQLSIWEGIDTLFICIKAGKVSTNLEKVHKVKQFTCRYRRNLAKKYVVVRERTSDGSRMVTTWRVTCEDSGVICR